ncbi:MAG: nucleotidyltransferase family protein, partial [Candidatus Bathyarchaeia archaeon]
MVTLSLKALILAGGFGTRLRPLSCTRPKILFPIINKPMLQWTFEKLSKSNIKEVILAVNHQTEAYIKMHKIPKNGLSIRYSRDPFKKPLGTGGPIKKAEKLIGYEESFLVLNGDIFADVNYAEIVKMHRENSAVATIALHTVEDPSRYGVAELTKENRIIRFIE